MTLSTPGLQQAPSSACLAQGDSPDCRQGSDRVVSGCVIATS
ncbi:hypothetical protein [Massilia sp. SYSU DXS3249]